MQVEAKTGDLKIETFDEGLVLTPLGAWTAEGVDAAARRAEKLDLSGAKGKTLAFDLGQLDRLDTVGVLVLHRLEARAAEIDAKVEIHNVKPPHQRLLDALSDRGRGDPPAKAGEFGPVTLLADVGESVLEMGKDAARATSFLGAVVAATGKLMLAPWRFRFTSTVVHLERVGLRAVPIIALISFLVGAIVAQQSIFQLKNFGATLFVVDLLGILVLRELGVLLTAIMVAGRSGSAFTAEIGSMKMREEIDALKTMGLDPIEILAMPRLVALVIAMPLLAFLASMSALLGGGLVAWIYGDVTPVTFLQRLKDALSLQTFFVGLVKAPFMAIVIGLIACTEGMKVEGSAESLGARTTSSVVKSIFIVIVLDGVFAMFFAAMGI
ncbi:phospholipid/cholesterol/gamma-HCH transport system permease protein [Methylopila capsulata]|uniref:ABC transporter permease n=1 Tax=Methylopila capsulata TaxID=61654 RepID=A0A9W6IYP6_9HYPH|nr:MlaE family lipid ABC transporter permease subunit [Methylopila capsulata]MBM7853240.1 phospholipid/cholesterol/gamma-HCH transport system permease protein [Methylopila capsulata]GLK57546.1 ABC transporter permease [Methylopila capsulata]